MNVKEKLQKEEKKLEALKLQRNLIDEKIKKVETEIERCNSIINQQKFSEATQVFTAKGLSIDEIMYAVQSGDLLSIQERMENMQKEKELTSNTN